MVIFSQPIRQNKSFKCTSLLTNIKYVETLFLSLWSKSKITISRLWLNLFSTGIPLTRTFEVDWTKQKFVISRPPLRMDVVNSLICAGNAPERLNTEPNFQPDMHTRSRGITTTNHTKASTPGGLCALKQLSPLLWVLITICLCSNSRSAFHLNKSVPYLHAFLSHLQDLALPVAALITWHLIQLLI